MRYIFFIISPFLTFLHSCFDLRSRNSRIIFVLFFCLFGFCHTFEDIRADSYRKYEAFTYYQPKSIEEIFIDYRLGDTKDIFEDILFSIVKSVSNDPHILMMIVGLFGGFFYMLVIKRFLQDKRINLDWAIGILILFMVIESNIPLMGGIRNFCAFPLFMYSLIRLLIDNKRIWIIGLLITPLIHFAYIISLIVALIIWFIKIPNGILHYLAITACISSLFLSTSSYSEAIDAFSGSIENDAITNRVSNYGEEETETHFNKSLTTQLTRVNNQIGAVFIVILLIYIRKNRANLLSSPYVQNIYNITLFFIVFSFVILPFSVVGQRYVYIAMVLLYFFLLNIYQYNKNTAIKYYIYSLPIVYIIHIAWTVYNCYCNTGLGIYFLPLPALIL